MKDIYIGLGSNLNNPAENVLKAFEEIQKIEGLFKGVCSPLYKTSPVSTIKQPDFINAVCGFDSNLEDPILFLRELQKIERRLGKVPKPKDAPRVMDIDLLIFKDQIQNTSELTLPHPEMFNRLFVLEPLSAITSIIYYPREGLNPIEINLDHTLLEFKNTQNEVVKKVEACNNKKTF